MKKIVGILIVLVVLFAGCSSKPPSKEAIAAARKMSKSLTVLMVKTIKEMKKATTSAQTGEAIVKYAKTLAKKNAEMMVLKKKYPDFDDAAKDGSITKDTKALQKSVGELNDLYLAAEKKYKDDKDFVKSLKDAKAIMVAAEKGTASVKPDVKKKNVKAGVKKVTPVTKKSVVGKKPVVK